MEQYSEMIWRLSMVHLKNSFHTHVIPVEDLVLHSPVLFPDNTDVTEAVQSLPPKYKNVVYLYFYGGYTAPEIGRILGKNVNTIYTYLTRSRKMLRQKLGNEDCD